MRKIVLILAIIFWWFSAQAQEQSKVVDKELLLKTRIDMLVKELAIPAEKIQEFGTIYKAYRKDISKVAVHKEAKLRKTEITNDNAAKVITARLMNTIATSSVKQKYINDFIAVIEPLQLEKLYRIDERIARDARKLLQSK
ncbi:MAG: hypothetical protein KBS95_08385 [Alistipes sp.]|nr:hypothetical protein [Candidatus Alistipes equi]